MSRKKDPRALGEYTRVQYARAIERAHGRKVPTKAPDFEAWPESTRKIYRAAIQAYWLERGDEMRGIEIAKQVHAGPSVERMPLFPNEEEAKAFFETAARTEPKTCWLVLQTIGRLGLRSFEGLKLAREKIEHTYRFGRLTVLGKGNVERAFHVPQLKASLRELLDTPRADGQPWAVLGELISPAGSFDTQRIYLTRYMHRVAETAGLDPKLWHPHTLRHVFSDAQLAAGTTERELQALLGHKRLETLSRYTHPRPERFSRNIR